MGEGLGVPLTRASSRHGAKGSVRLVTCVSPWQVRDLYLVGMVEVDHKKRRDNRLSTGRSERSCPSPSPPPGPPWQPTAERLLP